MPVTAVVGDDVQITGGTIARAQAGRASHAMLFEVVSATSMSQNATSQGEMAEWRLAADTRARSGVDGLTARVLSTRRLLALAPAAIGRPGSSSLENVATSRKSRGPTVCSHTRGSSDQYRSTDPEPYTRAMYMRLERDQVVPAKKTST